MREPKSTIFLSFVFSFVLAFAGVRCAMADDVTDALPATFLPISNDSWLADGAQIVIGGVYRDEQSLFIATATASGSFLQANATNYQQTDSVTIDLAAQIWTLEAKGANFLLRSGENYIAKGKTDTALKLSTKRSEAIPYRITKSDDGAFVFSNTLDANRYLALDNTVAGGYQHFVFGNYKDNGSSVIHLRLFRYEHATLHIGGEAVMPGDGIKVCLYGNGMVYPKNDTEEGAIEAADYLLSDGTMAVAAPARSWTTEVRDASHLALISDDGHYLNANLEATDGVVWWELRDGSLWSDGRVLRYLPSTRRFSTLTSEEASNESGESVVFLPMADEPVVTIEDGVLKVAGGLSASELADIDWQGAYMLDLSDTPLPLYSRQFNARPIGKNNLVLVNDATARFVPSDWEFVVCKSNYTLLTNATLTDREPLRLPSDIKVSDAQVTYVRTFCGDGGWETLALPFSANIPVGVEAEKVASVDENNIYFQAAESLMPSIATLIRPTDAGMTSATFVSKAGMLTTETSGLLRGNYNSLTINTTTSLFLLSEDGTRFVQAAGGSRLAPFRAALQSDGTRAVKHK